MILFKVDFGKAYDSVCWEYLDYVMERMGFPVRCRQWSLECLSSARISVFVIGSPTEEFVTSRGLRQVDPLSPFLFLIVAEGLNVMFNKVIQLNFFAGFKFGDNGHPFTHLQFAYDTLIVGEGNSQNLWVIKSILQLFEVVSGLKVNFHNIQLIGINVEVSWLEPTTMLLKCKCERIPFNYLGLSIGANPWKLSTRKTVIEKVKNRLSSSKSRHLSFGGHIVVIQSVLYALPTYYLSFIKAPQGIISSIKSLFKKNSW